LDVWYVDNRSLWLDLQILQRTIGQVVKGEGLSHPGVATMEPFLGAERDASALSGRLHRP
jgi:hypothetical protein